MAIPEHRGQARLLESEFSATLHEIDGRVLLEIFDPTASFPLQGVARAPLAQLRSSSSYFTLLNLQRISAQARLGVGGVATYRVGVALEEALFPDMDSVRSDHWIAYVEDLAKIVHVTGLQHSIAFHGEDLLTLDWGFRAAAPMALVCPNADLVVELGQDAKTGGDLIGGPSITFTYPTALRFGTAIDLDAALTAMNRFRLLLSLIMGRVLAIDDAYMQLVEDGRPHRVRIHGLRRSKRSDLPADPVVKLNAPTELGPLTDRWLARYDAMGEAVDLHFQALEHRDLDPSLRFQLFVQAIEALHRRTVGSTGAKIDPGPVADALREANVKEDVIDRITGVLAHAHEPGLRQRLKYYWRLFQAELGVLRPGAKAKDTIGELAATRNFYAHRTDKTSQVLEGADLWDATELVKALSHLAILKEIEAPMEGIAERMVENRFVQFAIRD